MPHPLLASSVLIASDFIRNAADEPIPPDFDDDDDNDSSTGGGTEEGVQKIAGIIENILAKISISIKGLRISFLAPNSGKSLELEVAQIKFQDEGNKPKAFGELLKLIQVEDIMLWSVFEQKKLENTPKKHLILRLADLPPNLLSLVIGINNGNTSSFSSTSLHHSVDNFIEKAVDKTGPVNYEIKLTIPNVYMALYPASAENIIGVLDEFLPSAGDRACEPVITNRRGSELAPKKHQELSRNPQIKLDFDVPSVKLFIAYQNLQRRNEDEPIIWTTANDAQVIKSEHLRMEIRSIKGRLSQWTLSRGNTESGRRDYRINMDDLLLSERRGLEQSPIFWFTTGFESQSYHSIFQPSVDESFQYPLWEELPLNHNPRILIQKKGLAGPAVIEIGHIRLDLQLLGGWIPRLKDYFDITPSSNSSDTIRSRSRKTIPLVNPEEEIFNDLDNRSPFSSPRAPSSIPSNPFPGMSSSVITLFLSLILPFPPLIVFFIGISIFNSNPLYKD